VAELLSSAGCVKSKAGGVLQDSLVEVSALDHGRNPKAAVEPSPAACRGRSELVYHREVGFHRAVSIRVTIPLPDHHVGAFNTFRCANELQFSAEKS